MNFFDKRMQDVLLKSLRDSYPSFLPLNSLASNVTSSPDFDEFLTEEMWENKLLFNLNYMIDHNLVCRPAPIHIPKFNHVETPEAYRITSKGIDYLQIDGGLSATLNTVTVKFDVDNIRQLVEAGLLKANVPKEKQSALKTAIREAPGTVLQTAITKMVEKGLSDPVATTKAVAALFGVSW